MEPSPLHNQNPVSQLPVLSDVTRDELRNVYAGVSKVGMLFGSTGVYIDDLAKRHITLVADAIENSLQFMKHDSNWREFESITTNLFSKGELISTTFPPSWLINGGDIATVSSSYNQGIGTKITVPEQIYFTYQWKELVRRLRDQSYQDGTSTKYLAKDLELAYCYLKKKALI